MYLGNLGKYALIGIAVIVAVIAYSMISVARPIARESIALPGGGVAGRAKAYMEDAPNQVGNVLKQIEESLKGIGIGGSGVPNPSSGELTNDGREISTNSNSGQGSSNDAPTVGGTILSRPRGTFVDEVNSRQKSLFSNGPKFLTRSVGTASPLGTVQERINEGLEPAKTLRGTPLAAKAISRTRPTYVGTISTPARGGTQNIVGSKALFDRLASNLAR